MNNMRCILLFCIFVNGALLHAWVLPDYTSTDFQSIRFNSPRIHLKIDSNNVSGRVDVPVSFISNLRNRIAGESVFFLFLNSDAAVIAADVLSGNRNLKAFFLQKEDARMTYDRNVAQERRRINPRDPILVESVGGGMYRISVYPIISKESVIRIHWKEELVLKSGRREFFFPRESLSLFGYKSCDCSLIVDSDRILKSHLSFRLQSRSNGRKIYHLDMKTPIEQFLFSLTDTGSRVDKIISMKRRVEAVKKQYVHRKISWNHVLQLFRKLPAVSFERSLVGIERGMRIFRAKKRVSGVKNRRGRITSGISADGYGGKNSVILIPKGIRLKRYLPGSLSKRIRFFYFNYAPQGFLLPSKQYSNIEILQRLLSSGIITRRTLQQEATTGSWQLNNIKRNKGLMFQTDMEQRFWVISRLNRFISLFRALKLWSFNSTPYHLLRASIRMWR